MQLLALGDARPELAADAVVLTGATLVGAVTVGARSSIWYGAVLRGDLERVVVGTESNLQDNAVCHADPGFPVMIGNRVTVGHGAVIHGASVDDECLVGMGAVIMNGARIGRGSLVAAGSLLLQGFQAPPGSLVAGSPATVRRPVRPPELEMIEHGWRSYCELGARHAAAEEI